MIVIPYHPLKKRVVSSNPIGRFRPMLNIFDQVHTYLFLVPSPPRLLPKRIQSHKKHSTLPPV